MLRICVSALIFILQSHSNAVVDDGSIIHSGKATFYGDGGGGNCGFSGKEQPLYHGAMNHLDYDSSKACGTWVHINGPSGEVTAFIDDRCPECLAGDIDLGPGTFEKIADRTLGIAPITWHYVESPADGPIQYHWQSGSSRYNIALQIRNHRYALTTVEIKSAGSEWIQLTREFYNYFVLPGGVGNADVGPYTLRVTDIFGQQIVDSQLTILPDQTVPGSTNFNHRSNSVKKSATTGNIAKSVNKRYSAIINGYFHVANTNSLFNLYTVTGKRVASMKSFEEITSILHSSKAGSLLIIEIIDATGH